MNGLKFDWNEVVSEDVVVRRRQQKGRGGGWCTRDPGSSSAINSLGRTEMDTWAIDPTLQTVLIVNWNSKSLRSLGHA